MAAIVLFTISCAGLTLYLWLSFGGSIPLHPEGYRFTARIPEATTLAQQADVRISGVTVGKVEKLERSQATTKVEIEIDSKYAPIPADTRAKLRQKTLLGETFVELSSGNSKRGELADGGQLPDDQVEQSVEVDEILRSFDPSTRRDLSRWLTSMGAALDGRGEDVSDAVGGLAGTSEQAAGVLTVLDEQRGALSRLIRDSGVVFGAVGDQEAATRGLITSGKRVLATTARRDRELAATVATLPTFLRELRATLTQVGQTSDQLGPTVAALRPVAPLLAPTLSDVADFSPDLERTLTALGPAIDASKRGVPAATRTLAKALPLLQRLYPFARDLAPIVAYTDSRRYETIGGWPKVAAASEVTRPDPVSGQRLNYIRIFPVLGLESLAGHSRRLPSNRHNAYPRPRWLDRLATGQLESFDCRQATGPLSGVYNPPCLVQTPSETGGRASQFPRLERAEP
jgi:virulence factor Mce-like protein